MSRYFDTSSTYLDASISAESTPLTLSLWLKPVNATTGSECEILRVYDSISNDGWFLGFTPDNPNFIVVARTRQGGSTENATKIGTTNLGQWYHLGAVFASATSRIAYLDGVAGGADVQNKVPTTTNTIRIGTAGIDHDSHVAWPTIWNAALTGDEMMSLARGIVPTKIRPASLAYSFPLWGRFSPEPNLIGSPTLTVNGAPSQTDHPRILYGRRRKSALTFGTAPVIEQPITIRATTVPHMRQWQPQRRR